MSDVEIVVADDPVESAARLIAEAVGCGGHIAVSGGSSPRPAYERVAVLRPDWSNVDLWFVDERVVPPYDDRANYKLVRESLLAGLARPPVVHRVRGELSPEEAADAYDADLEGVTISLALMGIGPDGHTASLFPDAPALEVTGRRALAAEAGMEPFVPRVTLSLPFLAEVDTMVFLVTGESKAEAVERAFARKPALDTPASLVRGKRTIAVLDAAAASRL